MIIKWAAPIRAAIVVLTTGTVAGCSGPQSALDPAGPGAEIISWLWWGMFSFFTLVLFVVTGLWLYAMRRPPSDPSDRDAARFTNRWIIGGGIILPLLSISVLLAAGIPAGQSLLLLSDEATQPLRVEAHAQRWWWGFYYPESGITTGNQMVIPVDTPIDIGVHSDNVIHAFWVPRLGGKIDVVPGRVNQLRLRASETGTMRGQCTEFCGVGHAHMVFEVTVLSQEDFKAWQARQTRPINTSGQNAQAAEEFKTYCGDCHRVRGLSSGSSGPDLTHIASRSLSHIQHRQKTALNIEQWLQQPHPRFHPEQAQALADVEPEKIARIAAWLETLEL